MTTANEDRSRARDNRRAAHNDLLMARRAFTVGAAGWSAVDMAQERYDAACDAEHTAFSADAVHMRAMSAIRMNRACCMVRTRVATGAHPLPRNGGIYK